MSDQTQQQQLQIPQKLISLKEKIGELGVLSDNIKTKITKISEITPSTNPNSNRKKNQGSTAIVNILTKYKNYVDYLKDILEVKFKKDKLIITFQKDVFSYINPIIDTLGKHNIAIMGSNPNQNDLMSEKTKLTNRLKQKQEDLDKLSNEIKQRYLVDIDEKVLENKYRIEGNEIEVVKPNESDYPNAKDLITLLETDKGKKLLNCNVQSAKKDLESAIKFYRSEIEPKDKADISKQGGANVPTIDVSDRELFNALNIDDVLSSRGSPQDTFNNSKKKEEIKKHTESLKIIRDKYEEGLKTNIKEFKINCEALKGLIGAIASICRKYNEQIRTTRNQTTELKRQQEYAISQLKQQIEDINGHITRLRKGEGAGNITLLGLDTSPTSSLLNKIDNVFKENKKALENIKKEINTKQGEFITKHGNLRNSPSLPRQSPQQNIPKVQGPGQGTSNPEQQVQGRDTSNTDSVVTTASNSSEISAGIQEFLEGFKEGEEFKQVQLNNEEKNTITNIQEQINQKLDELKNLKDVNVGNRDQEEITKLEDEIKQLFEQANFDITNEMKTELKKIPSTVLTDQQRDLVFKYIRLLTYNGDFEAGLRALEEDTEAKNLLEQILETTNDNERHSLLLKLYENRPDRKQGGGKYKMKKSKKSKSKSKTTKATPKKAKSTKKPRTTRTQTKSYNNPKYKNQDGGFVRGGVLFPESFYRSDIVM